MWIRDINWREPGYINKGEVITLKATVPSREQASVFDDDTA